jgi:hypothetical protein
MEADPGVENQTDADAGAAAAADTYVQVGFTQEQLQRKEARRESRDTRIQRALEHHPEVSSCVRASARSRELMRTCICAHIYRHRAGGLAEMSMMRFCFFGITWNNPPRWHP